MSDTSTGTTHAALAPVNFAVWAPRPESVALHLDGAIVPMNPDRDRDGWWTVTAQARPDARYGFLLDDDPTVLPDPRSPRQPDGVHEPSGIYDARSFEWTDSAWTGRQLAGGVLYELHVGTFTEAGTFDSALERLDHLVNLGVTHVEIMPVNAFNGVHNWGYDGVLWYAVQETYGGPAGLQRFVDGCHRAGLAVVLDAVYNHLGPSGNYLDRFGPYTRSAAANPWGPTINLDGPDSDTVRRYILDNALRWFDEFHIDALRLDAVHALIDSRAVHILEQLAIETEALSAHLGRPLGLIAESDLNDPRLITPRAAGGYGLTAQWDDDVHHAIHAAVSGERQGYYGDFGALSTLATVLTRGWFHAETYSSFRGRIHGRPLDVDTVPGSALVAYTTTHDQVGNRAIGDRPATYLSAGQVAIKAALVFFSAYTPMIFMGEEWGTTTAFQFFTSHPEPELGAATAKGRRAEFAEHGWDTQDVPDPQDPETFARSHLEWAQTGDEPHRRILGCYRDLLALRRSRPEITDPRLPSVGVTHDDTSWIAVDRGPLTLVCNLSAEAVTVAYTGTALLFWDTPSTTQDGTSIPGHSFVILDRTAG